MPCLSAYEACKDVPLAVINSSLSKPPSRIAQRVVQGTLVAKDEAASAGRLAFPLSLDEELGDFQVTGPDDEQNPKPDDYDEFVIHTYARPNGLVCIKKPPKERNQPTPVKVARRRDGVNGWKLLRPKTAQVRANSANRVPRKINQKKEVKEIIQEFYDEPYLKFLADKRKSVTAGNFKISDVVK
jgi:hypothetical protein